MAMSNHNCNNNNNNNNNNKHNVLWVDQLVQDRGSAVVPPNGPFLHNAPNLTRGVVADDLDHPLVLHLAPGRILPPSSKRLAAAHAGAATADLPFALTCEGSRLLHQEHSNQRPEQSRLVVGVKHVVCRTRAHSVVVDVVEVVVVVGISSPVSVSTGRSAIAISVATAAARPLGW